MTNACVVLADSFIFRMREKCRRCKTKVFRVIWRLRGLSADQPKVSERERLDHSRWTVSHSCGDDKAAEFMICSSGIGSARSRRRGVGCGSGGYATLAQLRATSPRRASRDRGREYTPQNKNQQCAWIPARLNHAVQISTRCALVYLTPAANGHTRAKNTSCGCQLRSADRNIRSITQTRR